MKACVVGKRRVASKTLDHTTRRIRLAEVHVALLDHPEETIENPGFDTVVLWTWQPSAYLRLL